MATDFLLEIEGIKGESKDHKHKDTIECHSFSWGGTNSGTMAAGGGGGAGKANFQDLSFSFTACKASPELFGACATGKHIKKAVLFVRKAGEEAHDYYKVTLEDILVSSYQSGGHGETPSDSSSLNYAKIKFEYQEQDEKGAIGAAVVATYDLKAGKK